ncbi:MAG TPA: hypothetical protein VHC20_05920 [Candidatus Paceibacterota bacterium]|nr:hypothetical protein [Candidatus Paceibacterota bacterium]
MDLRKIQGLVTRERVTEFLESLGIDPVDVAEVRMYPNRLILTRYLNNPDGTRQLDSLGPRTAETYFTIN